MKTNQVVIVAVFAAFNASAATSIIWEQCTGIHTHCLSGCYAIVFCLVVVGWWLRPRRVNHK